MNNSNSANDFENIKFRIETAQKLLSRVEKDFDTSISKIKDPLKLLEITNKSLQTYELCAQEFSFELDILQLNFFSLFFNQWLKGYHKQINFLLKYSVEKLNNQTMIIMEESLFPSIEPKKEKEIEIEPEKFQTNLFENFEKINQKTQIQMAPKQKEQNQNDPFSVSILPINGKPGGVDSNSNYDRQAYTIQLLRVELMNNQSKSTTMSKKIEELTRKLEKTEDEKKNFEEELIKLLKKEKLLKDLDDSSKYSNINNNRTGGGYSKDDKNDKKSPSKLKKNNDSNNKKDINNNLKENSNNLVLDNKESDPIADFLKKLEEKKRPVIEEQIEKPKELIKENVIISQEDENEKINKDEMDKILENRDKIYLNIKESGVTKELKNVLRQIAVQKNKFNVFSNELHNENADDSEEEIKKDKGPKEIEKNKIKINHKEKKSPEKKNNIPVQKTLNKYDFIDRFTQPDQNIFDINIIDVQKFAIDKFKNQTIQLEDQIQKLEKLLKQKEIEKKELKQQFDNEKIIQLQNNSKIANFDYETNQLISKLKEEQKINAMKDKKLMKKKLKIDNLKEIISKFTNDGKILNEGVLKAKMDNLEAKQDTEKLKNELKSTKNKLEQSFGEITKLQLENADYKNDLIDFTDKINLIEKNKKIIEETLGLKELELTLSNEQNEVLISIINQSEESKKNFETYKSSDKYKENQLKLEDTRNLKLQLSNQRSIRKTATRIMDKSYKNDNIELSPSTPKNEKNHIRTPSRIKDKESTLKPSLPSVSGIKSLDNNKNLNKNNNKKKNQDNNNSKVEKEPIKMKDDNKNIEKKNVSNSKNLIKKINFTKNNDNEKSISSKSVIQSIDEFNTENDGKEIILLKRNLEKETKIKEKLENETIHLKQKVEILQKKLNEYEENHELLNNKLKNHQKQLETKENKTPIPIISSSNKDTEIIKDKLINKIETLENENEKYIKKNIIEKNDQKEIKTTEDYFIQTPKNQDKKSTEKHYFISNFKNTENKTQNKSIEGNISGFSDISHDAIIKKNPILKKNKPVSESKNLQKRDLKKNTLYSVNINDDVYSLKTIKNDQNSEQSIDTLPITTKNEKNKKKEEVIKTNLYENFMEIIKNNETETSDLDLLIKLQGNNEKVPSFEKFKEILNNIENEHKGCGKNCIHLKRFYEKLGYYKNQNKTVYHIHKRTINKLPKIQSYKLVN